VPYENKNSPGLVAASSLSSGVAKRIRAGARWDSRAAVSRRRHHCRCALECCSSAREGCRAGHAVRLRRDARPVDRPRVERRRAAGHQTPPPVAPAGFLEALPTVVATPFETELYVLWLLTCGCWTVLRANPHGSTPGV